MFQKIQAIGYAGSDPIQRETANGHVVTNFSLAVNEKIGDTERTTWYTVTTWKALAQVASEYVHKGKLVFIEGRPSLESWTGDDGAARARLVITANEMRLLSKAETMADEIPY